MEGLRSLVGTVYRYGTCSLNFLLAHVVIATIAHSQNPQTPAGFLPVYNTAKTGIIENGARTSVISPFGSRGNARENIPFQPSVETNRKRKYNRL